jgi:RES domain-containing protein
MPGERPPAHRFVQEVAYRATSYDVPFWAGPNRRSGRWNVAGEGIVQYLALDAEAPWAELLRAEGLETEAEAALLQATLWQAQVSDQPIADYATFEQAEHAGFPPEALVDDDWGRCQREARRLERLGYRGVLAPCAARAGSLSLTLFGPRVAVPWGTTVRTASTLPAQPLATGRPPAGLVGRVRQRGQPHPGLVDHLARRRPR